MAEKLAKPDSEWQKELSPEQYYVTRKAGTEPAFTGKYWNSKDPGMYTCACCGQPLFSSETKFDSGTGWPSFYKPAAEGVVEEHTDSAHGMRRTEVMCTALPFFPVLVISTGSLGLLPRLLSMGSLPATLNVPFAKAMLLHQLPWERSVRQLASPEM